MHTDTKLIEIERYILCIYIYIYVCMYEKNIYIFHYTYYILIDINWVADRTSWITLSTLAAPR